MSNDVIMELAVAVVRQAIDDWRWLCKGNKETEDCNFKELEHFFENECADYLTSNDLAERIYNLMKLERRRAVNCWANINSR